MTIPTSSLIPDPNVDIPPFDDGDIDALEEDFPEDSQRGEDDNLGEGFGEPPKGPDDEPED